MMHQTKNLVKRISFTNLKVNLSTCPHVQNTDKISELENARPYSEVPGPKPIPILGNTWRFVLVTCNIYFVTNIYFSCRLMPIIGQYQISEIAQISFLLNEAFGKIVKLGGIIGRPDLLFVYDVDETEKV